MVGGKTGVGGPGASVLRSRVGWSRPATGVGWFATGLVSPDTASSAAVLSAAPFSGVVVLRSGVTSLTDVGKILGAAPTVGGGFVDKTSDHGGGANFNAVVRGTRLKGSVLVGVA